MKFHHVGIAVPDVAAHADGYCRALGLERASDIVDDHENRARLLLVHGGGVFIEFVAPLGDDSPVAGVLSRGGGLYHVCYVVVDLAAAIDGVVKHGGRLVSAPRPAPLFGGRRVAFVYTRDRLLVEFLEDR